MDDNIILSTFLSTLKAVSTVLIIYCIGFSYVKYSHMTPVEIKIISQLVNDALLVCLLIPTFGSQISIEMIEYAYMIPIISFIVIIYYFFLGTIVARFLAKPSAQFYRMYLVAGSVSDGVSVPIILKDSLCDQVQFRSPARYITLDTNDTISYLSVEDCKQLGSLYAFLYGSTKLVMSFVVFWTYLEIKTQPKDDLEIKSEKNEQTSLLSIFKKQFCLMVQRPVIVAQFIGILIGIIPPIKNLLFTEEAPLRSLTNGLSSVGAAAIPLYNLVLAFTLAVKIQSMGGIKLFLQKFFKGSNDTTENKGTVIWFAISTMILFPMTSIPIYTQILPFITPDDQLMRLLILMNTYMPSAGITVIIAQYLGLKESAENVAIGTLMQYLFGLVTITIWTFISLLILDI